MSDKLILKKLWLDTLPFRKILYLGIILYLPVTALGISQPVLIGFAVQNGMLEGSAAKIIFYAALFICLIAVHGVVEYFQGLSLQTVGQRLVFTLRQRAFSKVQKLSMGFLDKTPMGKLMTRLSNDSEAVAEMFSMGAVQIIGDLLFLVGTFVALLLVDFKLTLYSASVLPVLALGIYFFRRWTRKAFVAVRTNLSKLNSFLQEHLSGLETTQVSNRVENSREIFSGFNKNYLVANRNAVFLDAAIYSFVDAMSYITSAVVLYGAFNLKLDQALSLGVLVAFIEALSRFYQPIREISNRYAVFQSALVALERIYELFEWPEEDQSVSTKMPSFENCVEFSQVSFSYENGEQVLDQISFTLKKGERIALVGHTGAGKSTVIKLINRFYHVDHGSIKIDNKNINDMSLGYLRNLITVVPQEVFLFKGSLRQNLIFGRKDASDQDLWDALSAVQLEESVRKKGGLDLAVASKGSNFSLGERQLLALARALVTDPPILILDEATASVDARTEGYLQQAIKIVLENRSALIIAHRLSTIMDADRILVFHKGKIVEQGTHKSLMAQDGVYAGLIKLQEKERNFQRQKNTVNEKTVII